MKPQRKQKKKIRMNQRMSQKPRITKLKTKKFGQNLLNIFKNKQPKTDELDTTEKENENGTEEEKTEEEEKEVAEEKPTEEAEDGKEEEPKTTIGVNFFNLFKRKQTKTDDTLDTTGTSKKEEEEENKEEAEEEKTTVKTKEPKAPVMHTKNWEEGKVYLYQSSRTPLIPSIYPQELKLETFMKLHGVPYENVDHKANLTSKKGSLPFVELNGEEISEGVLPKIAEKFEKTMSAHLTAEQKTVEHAMLTMVESHLYWAIMHWRTLSVDNTLKAYKIHLPTFMASKITPALLRLCFKSQDCKKMQKKVKSMELNDVEELGKNDMQVLSQMLGEKDYLFGAEPALLDLTVFGVLSQLTSVDPDYPCPLRDYLTTETPNLAALLTRLRERVWADHWEAATGTTLELNPHIPKPEPEEPKIETETKEEATEEKKKDEAVEKQESQDESAEKKEEETKEEVKETEEETPKEDKKETE